MDRRRRNRASGPRRYRSGRSLPRGLTLDHLAGHRDRSDLEGDPVFAGFELTEFLARIAMREAVDDLVLRVRDQADQATADLRVAVRRLWIDEEHRHVAIALEVLRPGAIGVAVEPDEAVFQLEPDRIQLHGAVVPLGSEDDQDRQRSQLLHRGAQDWLLSASHRPPPLCAAARSES